jgi:hypothetical protein
MRQDALVRRSERRGCDLLADNEGAHTSASLMVTDDAGAVAHHVLVNAGLGTLSNLREAVRQPSPIPTWCMVEVGDRPSVRPSTPPAQPPAKPRESRLRFLPFELDRWVGTAPAYRAVCPPGPNSGLRVTAVGGVAQANGVIFVLEVEGRKIILVWDVGKLPRDRDGRTAGAIPEELRAILGDVDLMVIESNTLEKWDTGLIRTHLAARFIKETGRPDTPCTLVHYSGLEGFFVSPPGRERTPICDNVHLESEVQRLDGRLEVARAGDEVEV